MSGALRPYTATRCRGASLARCVSGVRLPWLPPPPRPIWARCASQLIWVCLPFPPHPARPLPRPAPTHTRHALSPASMAAARTASSSASVSEAKRLTATTTGVPYLSAFCNGHVGVCGYGYAMGHTVVACQTVACRTTRMNCGNFGQADKPRVRTNPPLPPPTHTHAPSFTHPPTHTQPRTHLDVSGQVAAARGDQRHVLGGVVVVQGSAWRVGVCAWVCGWAGGWVGVRGCGGAYARRVAMPPAQNPEELPPPPHSPMPPRRASTTAHTHTHPYPHTPTHICGCSFSLQRAWFLIGLVQS